MHLNVQTQQAVEALFASVPTRLESYYMVLARQGQNWHTLMEKTNNLAFARDVMYAASNHHSYSRVVLCHARGQKGELNLKWSTMECAIPMSARVVQPSQNLSNIIERIRVSSANKNAFSDVSMGEAVKRPRVKRSTASQTEREFSNIGLTCALFGAALHLNLPSILVCLCLLVADFGYVSRSMDKLIGRKRAQTFAQYRHWVFLAAGFAMIISGLWL